MWFQPTPNRNTVVKLMCIQIALITHCSRTRLLFRLEIIAESNGKTTHGKNPRKKPTATNLPRKKSKIILMFDYLVDPGLRQLKKIFFTN